MSEKGEGKIASQLTIEDAIKIINTHFSYQCPTCKRTFRTKNIANKHSKKLNHSTCELIYKLPLEELSVQSLHEAIEDELEGLEGEERIQRKKELLGSLHALQVDKQPSGYVCCIPSNKVALLGTTGTKVAITEALKLFEERKSLLTRAQYYRNRDKILTKAKEKRKQTYWKKYSKKNYDNNKDRWFARMDAQKIPLKDKCENCGSTEKLERHHPDYSKPLEVQTLCINCHKKIHRKPI